ncbi:MAG: ATP-binding protein [Chitinispirillales bacterium]|jgi:predicted AAA+ superfamily ATPase|nr:ATP-binding protein [Chitinispirillales bacterium]
MLIREKYLETLASYSEKPIIKVLTGIRRCGKSTLLQNFAKKLIAAGVKEEQIISLNFEDLAFERLKEYHALYEYVTSKIKDDETRYYIFLDEIQEVASFERVVDSLHLRKNCDIYITGSNAFFMSGELATLLSGRYIEIPIFPLSFAEFRDSYKDLSKYDLYSRYITQGALPYLINRENSYKEIREYYGGIYNTVLLKNVVSRKRIAAPDVLEKVVKFLAGNIGSLNSTKKIADTLTSHGRKISVNTLESYIGGLVDSLLFYRASRFDIKGKEHLKTIEKYYIADLGFRNYLLNNEKSDFGFVLENVIYLELLRRGYKVSVGKAGTQEIDFVAISALGQTEYYQVALTIRDNATFEREVSVLTNVKDNFPKILLHIDPDPDSVHEGINILNALDWLLKG